MDWVRLLWVRGALRAVMPKRTKEKMAEVFMIAERWKMKSENEKDNVEKTTPKID